MKVYCPRCGQEQISNQTRFCSRCGFLMTGISEIVITGGLNQQLQSANVKLLTPRKRGLKQGGAWFLLGIFLVPLLGVLSLLIRFPEEIIGLAAIIFFVGGIVRMIYALIFESGNPADKTLEENVIQTAQKLLNKKPQANALPPQQSIPISGYVPPIQGNWRDTNDLVPNSVTDGTTKLLEKD
ncbi:MAG: zinc ribbon domain-containing protein [Actinomycetota bacterium]